MLGFIGAPYTMATYCVEGGTSASYLQIKKMGCAAIVSIAVSPCALRRTLPPAAPSLPPAATRCLPHGYTLPWLYIC